MAPPISILADGISPGMIFGIFVAILFLLANVLGKAKQSEQTQEKMRKQRQGREAAREGTLTDLIRQHMEPQRPRRSVPKKQRSKPVAAPLPLPAKPIAADSMEPEPILSPSRAAARNESARNVRLMLQPAGVREAFILSQVLEKPKALQDE